jgi:hypothetical protein
MAFSHVLKLLEPSVVMGHNMRIRHRALQCTKPVARRPAGSGQAGTFTTDGHSSSLTKSSNFAFGGRGM